jgi:predicted RNase H-like HicB family nuclease
MATTTVDKQIKSRESAIYKAFVYPESDGAGYWARCDLPGGGCVTQGATLQETQKNMLDAAALYLEDNPDALNYFLAFEVANG